MSQIGMGPGVKKIEHSMVNVADYCVVYYILLKFNSHIVSIFVKKQNDTKFYMTL